MRFTLLPLALSLVSATAAQQTEVSVMPGYPNAPKLSPEQRFVCHAGDPVFLWGNANRGQGIDPTATYEWYLAPNGNVIVTDDGDLTGIVADSRFIHEEVSFQIQNGSTREIVSATLIVDDGLNGAAQSTVELLILDAGDPLIDDPVKELRIDAEIAVQEALRYLYREQHPDGRWEDGTQVYNQPCSHSAFVLWAMQNQGHSHLNDPVEDILAEPIRRCFEYLFLNYATVLTDLADRSTPRADVALGATAPGISDLNQNGQVVRISPTYRPGYQVPIVTAAIVASLAPDYVVPVGALAGMTFREVVEDSIDWLGAKQNAGSDPLWAGTTFVFTDGRGGWTYTPSNSATRSDMSINSWAYIAMEGAMEIFDIDVPAWIKKQVEYTLLGHMRGEIGAMPFGYRTSEAPGGRNAMATTSGGLTGIVLAQTGVTPGDVIAQYTSYGIDTLEEMRSNALAHVGAEWDHAGGSVTNRGNRGNHYVMWTTARALRATARALGLPEGENVPLVHMGQTFDWETGAAPGSTVVPQAGPTEGYWNFLVRTQDDSPDLNERGRWERYQYSHVQATAMSILVLTRNVFLDPCPSLVTIPVESLDPPPGGSFEALTPFTFSGRAIRAGASRPLVAVEVDGRPVESLDANGQFFTSLMLQPGLNQIRIEAFDSCGSEVTLVELTGTTFGGGIGGYGDVTPFLELDYRNTTFNQANGWLVVEAAACSSYDQPLAGPILLAIDSFNTTGVQPVNADGFLPDGRPYFAFQAGVSDPPIAAFGCSTPRTLIFENPALEPFTFQTTWLAPGNAPPAFQTVPRVRTAADAVYTYEAYAEDPEGAAVSYALMAGPIGMTLDAATGSLSWMPTMAEIGTHQIVLEASDGTVGTARQTWTLEVAENVGSEPPYFVSAPLTQVAVGAAYAYQVETGDPTEDPRTVSLIAGPTGMAVDATGLVTWGFTLPGDHAVQLRVTDASGAYADQGFLLTVGSSSSNPHSPTIDGNPSVVAAADVPYIYQPIATDLDPFDVLGFSLDAAPTGMTVNPATGRIDWLPGIAQLGTADVVLRVDDGNGGFGLQAWTIDVQATLSNGAPVVTSIPNPLALAGTPYSYDVEAFDPEGDPIRFELVSPPGGMTIDPLTGIVDWTPAAGGSFVVAIQVFDGPASTGPFGSQVFTLQVAPSNGPPTIVSTPELQNPLGRVYYYDVNAVDPEAQPLTYELVAAPASATLDPVSGVVRWPATEFDPNPGQFEVVARDIYGAADTQNFQVTLEPDTEPPTVLITTNPTVANIGEPVSLCVVAADDVGVTERTLSAAGANVVLDPMGCAVEVFSTPGVIQLVATARDEAGNVTVETLDLAVVDPSATGVPTIAILSPAPGDMVVGPVDIIGTIDDDSPASLTWRVERRRAGEQIWTEISQGTGGVQAGTLAFFDTTMLANDSYDLRVIVDDGVNPPELVQFPYAVAGDYKLGDYATSFIDLGVPLAGFPLSVQRSYSSLDTSEGDFGHGWRLDSIGGLKDTAPEQGDPLTVAYNGATRVYVTLPTGQLQVFRFQPIGIPLFFGATAAFVPEGATEGTLELVLLEDTICYASGGLYFTPFQPYNPSLFRYTDGLGNEYLLEEGRGVQTITDTFGETIDVLPSGIYSSRGPAILFERDMLGRISRVVGPDPDPNDPIPPRCVEYTYDPASNNLIASVDPNGGMTEYLYGDPNFPRYVTEIRDPLGRSVLRNKFDAEGRLIAQCGPDGNIQTCQGCVAFEIDSSQDLQIILTAAGDRIELYYSERGELLVERRFVDATTVFEITRTYDEDGRMLSETLPNGATTSFEYDGAGRVLSFITAEGSVWSRTYGPCGIATEIAPDGDTTTFTYDEDCRPLTRVDARGGTTHFGYTPEGRPETYTTPAGASICLTYDGPAGRLTGFIDQEGQVEVIEVNDDGMADLRIDRTGRRTSYGYDEAGRVILEGWDSGNLIVSEYDAAGRRTRIEDAVSRLEFTYWPSGALRESRTTWLSDGAVERVVYGEGDINAPTLGYDLRGHRTSILDSHGGVTLFEHDALGRLTSMRWPGAAAPLANSQAPGSNATVIGSVAGAAGPDGSGQATVPPETTVRQIWNDPMVGDSWIMRGHELIPGGPTASPAITTRFGYDSEGEPNALSSIEHVLESTGQPIASLSLIRGVDGFYRSWTDAEGVHDMVLDGKEQILSVDHPPGAQPDEAYTYDGNGNRIASHLDTGYTHSVDAGQGSDRLLSTDRYDFTYDEVGSLLRMEETATGETFDFTYDHRRRVRSITRLLGGVVQRTVEMEYDPFDRLIEQRVDGTVKRFVYDGVNPILIVDDAGNVLERRMYTQDFDEVRAVWRPDEVLWPLRDQVGTVRDWASADGLTTTHVTYDTFGQRLAGDVSALPALGFQSRDQIADLPFYDFRMRTYDPRLGRFLQEDQVKPWGYAFAGNDPVYYGDPTGYSALQQYACLSGFSVGAGLTIGNIVGGTISPIFEGVALGLEGGGGGGASAALGRKGLQNFVLGITIDVIILVLPLDLPCVASALDAIGDVGSATGLTEGGGFKSRFIGDPFKGLIRPFLEMGPGPFGRF